MLFPIGILVDHLYTAVLLGGYVLLCVVGTVALFFLLYHILEERSGRRAESFLAVLV